MLWSFNKKVSISDHDGKGKSQEGHEKEKRKNILLNLCDNYVNFTIFLIITGLFIAAISYVYFFGIFLASSSEGLSNKTLTDTLIISVEFRKPETNSTMNNVPNATEITSSDPAPY